MGLTTVFLFAVIFSSSFAQAMDLKVFKEKCMVATPKATDERAFCEKEMNAYCSVNPPQNVKDNCVKMVNFMRLQASEMEGPVSISSVYSMQKFLFAEWGVYATDLSKAAPALSNHARNTVLAISEQCSQKYGKGKTPWNSYQLMDAGKAWLSPRLKTKRAEIESLIRKNLPTCPDPKKQMTLLAITDIEGMSRPTVVRMTEDKKSQQVIQEGNLAPDLK